MSNRKGQGARRALVLHLDAQLADLATRTYDLRTALAHEEDPAQAGPLVLRLQLADQDRQRLERRRERLLRQRAEPGALAASDVLAEHMERKGITPVALEAACSLTMSEVLDLLAGRKMTERQAGALTAAGFGDVETWRKVSGGFAPD